MLYLWRRAAVVRVSSHKIRSALVRVSMARGLKSPRLPIGVATRVSPLKEPEEESAVE